MSEHGKVFSTVVKCMDGRDLNEVVKFVKDFTHADYVDTITWPGPDKALAENSVAQAHFERCVGISVNKHGSGDVFVFGHDDCAGDPVDKETHIRQERKAAEILREKFPSIRVRSGHVNLLDGVWTPQLNED